VDGDRSVAVRDTQFSGDDEMHKIWGEIEREQKGD
jgi:hypothetical protein